MSGTPDLGQIISGIATAIVNVINALVSAIGQYAPVIVTIALIGLVLAGVFGYLDRIPVVGSLFRMLRGRLFGQ